MDEIESLPIVQAGYIVVAVFGLASLGLIYLHYREHPSWEGPVDAGIVALSLIVVLWVLVTPDADDGVDPWLVRLGLRILRSSVGSPSPSVAWSCGAGQCFIAGCVGHWPGWCCSPSTSR